jgi:hypothetical protein
MILKKQSYKTEIINKRFAHAYFKDKALPSGNVLVFCGELDPGQGYDFSQYSIDYMEEAIHFVYENPMIQDAVSSALFSHFMASSIANILSQEFLKMPLSVNMDTILVNTEFKRKGIILFKCGLIDSSHPSDMAPIAKIADSLFFQFYYSKFSSIFF